MFEPQLNIRYDKADDVLYVDFGTTEASVTDEITEDLLVDIGFYSGMVTGFRVIAPKKRGITVKVILQQLVPKVQHMAERRAQRLLRSVSLPQSRLRHALSV